MTDRQEHWNSVFGTKDPLKVSWYQKVPQTSLDLIANAGATAESRVIDVGGGSSALVDSLLQAGFLDIAVLDISEKALAIARQRVCDSADKVDWIVSDITCFEPPHVYDVWHDRAVLHFLTEEQDQKKYVQVLKKALKPGAAVIIGAFAIGGPERCSGLPIVQYDAEKLSGLLGASFHLVEERQEVHVTPSEEEQQFAFFRYQYSL
jgi:2-polyprenyl-3-methyl-5-hydroxy-6-metoxy-1,4-benzoquinol methylase